MNSRLTIQDLAALLADYTGKDKRATELFLKEFIAVVTEGVYSDRLVKVKGLGTFKIVAVEKRESVHVNTGERFVIPAHYKFSFLPDKELKELVNKPFSFFETTELNEDVDFSDLDQQVGEERESDTEDESVEELMPDQVAVESEVGEPAAASGDEAASTQPEAEVFQPEMATQEQPEQEEPLPTELQANQAEPPAERQPVPAMDEKPLNDSQLDAQPQELHETAAEEEPMPAAAAETPQPGVTEEAEAVAERNSEEAEAAAETLANATEAAAETAVETVDRPIGQPSSGRSLAGTVWLITVVVLLTAFFLYTRGFFENRLYPQQPLMVERIDTLSIPAETISVDREEAFEPIDTLTVAIEPQPSDSLPPETTPEERPQPESREPVIAKVTIQVGDRLTLISRKYYGHKIFWVYLFEHNRSTIVDPNNIPIGTEIEIPAAWLYEIDPEDEVSMERASRKQSDLLTRYRN